MAVHVRKLVVLREALQTQTGELHESRAQLVGGLEHVLFSHILGIIIPIHELICFSGVGQPPTSQDLGPKIRALVTNYSQRSEFTKEGDLPIESNISIPSGLTHPGCKRSHKYGLNHLLMGQLTISIAIFKCYVSHYQGVYKSMYINIRLNHYNSH